MTQHVAMTLDSVAMRLVLGIRGNASIGRQYRWLELRRSVLIALVHSLRARLRISMTLPNENGDPSANWRRKFCCPLEARRSPFVQGSSRRRKIALSAAEQRRAFQ